MDQKQLDRIERKLDEMLAFRDLLLKMALPRVPAPMREKLAAVVAGRQAGT
jgi:hypothetical protein